MQLWEEIVEISLSHTLNVSFNAILIHCQWKKCIKCLYSIANLLYAISVIDNIKVFIILLGVNHINCD